MRAPDRPTIVFPDYHSWHDLFPSFSRGPKRLDGEQMYQRGGARDSYIDTYCVIQRSREDPRETVHVYPYREVISEIERHTIAVDHDRVTFEVIVWSETEALVHCQNGQIIGGCWLAIIDPSTIP